MLLKEKTPGGSDAEGFREAPCEKEKLAVSMPEIKAPPPLHRSGIAYVGQRLMSPEQWAAVPDNVRQRNTSEHAELAVRKHLAGAFPTHASVVAALLPDGSLMKVEGHTRSLLWQTGRLEPPAMVRVDVYSASDKNAAGDLYDAHDNRHSTKHARDRMYGALREAQLVLDTPMLAAGGFRDAGLAAYRLIKGYPQGGVDEQEIIRLFRRQLVSIDSIHPTSRVFVSPILTAALITLRVHEERALAFWADVQADLGRKVAAKRDGVQAVRQVLSEMRERKDSQGRRVWYVNRCCSAFERWRVGAWIEILKPMSDGAFKSYIDRARGRD